jgi:glycosyltransferase involved in cell wall biosynthesis
MDLNTFIQDRELHSIQNDIIKCTNLILVIPMYNESKNITELLSRISNSNLPINKIIIIDDKSTDNSVELVKTFQNSEIANDIKDKIVLLQNDINYGTVVCLLKGFRQVYKYMDSDSIIIRMDSDLEHQPEDISDLIKDVSKQVPFSLGYIPYDKRSGYLSYFLNTVLGPLPYDKYKNITLPQFCSGFYAIHNSIFKEVVEQVFEERYKYKGEFLFIDFLMFYLSNDRFNIVKLSPIENNHIKKIGLLKFYKYFKVHLDLINYLEKD